MSEILTHSSSHPNASKTKEKLRGSYGLSLIFILVSVSQLAFGMWMNHRGFLWNDAVTRATNALQVLYSSDPHLGAIGLVWMPLPTFVQMTWVAFYPLWPDVVASGFASTFTTALAGGLTATILLGTARAMGLSKGYGWLYSLAIAFNPMLFLYGTNGMSEGVAAPFLTGAVCCLTLFWCTGRRRYIAAGAVALALGFASIYQAVHFGAALFAALVLGIVWNSETRKPTPQGRWRAVEGLGILFLVPSAFVGALWILANMVIMGDPTFFADSQYSNMGYSQTVDLAGGPRIAREAQGDYQATILFAAPRAAPFLIPGAFLLFLRGLDGRFLRTNTVSLAALLLVVPVGLITPLIYQGASFGWLRFFIYPLFAAAGWGLFEIAASRRKKLGAATVLASWLVSAPFILSAMADPLRGQEENHVIQGLVSGENARESGYVEAAQPLTLQADVASYLEEELEGRVALDSVRGWALLAQLEPNTLKNKVLSTSDRRFHEAVNKPGSYGVTHFLVPTPEQYPNDLIASRWPELYAGDEPGFKLVEEFPETPERWRLYEIVPSEGASPARKDSEER